MTDEGIQRALTAREKRHQDYDQIMAMDLPDERVLFFALEASKRIVREQAVSHMPEFGAYNPTYAIAVKVVEGLERLLQQAEGESGDERSTSGSPEDTGTDPLSE